MGKKTAGTVYIKADSQSFTVTGDVEYKTSDPERTPIEGGRGAFSEVDAEPYISFTGLNEAGLDMKKLREETDMAITAELKNGKVFVLTGGYWSGEKVVNGTAGTTAYTFHGVKGVEQ